MYVQLLSVLFYVSGGEERNSIYFDRATRQFRNANWKLGGRSVGRLARGDKLQEASALKVVASLSFRLIEPPEPRAVEESLGCV